MLSRHVFRSTIALPLLLTTLLTPLAGVRPTPSLAAVAQVSGTIPWHPQYTARIDDRVSASVDLADGHLDVATDDIDVPARGPDLYVHHVWDSVLALNGGGTAGAGLVTNLSQQITGSAGSTVIYTDASGAQWTFPYVNGAYQTPIGLPWSLSLSAQKASIATLTNILTGETLTLQARSFQDSDAYGNTNVASGSADDSYLSNSGGRAFSSIGGSATGMITSIASPQAVGDGRGTSDVQSVSYSYAGQQLTGITLGSGSTDATTTQFGYTGTLLTSVTTPMAQTWSFQYDSSNRIITITSPISGSVGQAGYTPAYTTKIQYNAGSTIVTEGYGTAGAVSTTYTLDGSGQATAIADALGDTLRFTYDADHDVQTYTDGRGNVTTYHYRYVGSGGSYGLLTETDYPAIHARYPSSAASAPITYDVYDPSTNDLLEQYDNYGAYAFYTYDGHHSVATIAQLTGSTVSGGTTTYHWRGQIFTYDQYGELTSQIDGRGVNAPNTTSLAAGPLVSANAQASSYTHSYGYNGYGDLTSSATPPIQTTTDGSIFATGPVTTTYGYDANGLLTSMLQPNPVPSGLDGNTLYTYDNLGRLINTRDPRITTFDNAQQNANPMPTIAYDGDGNVAQQRNGNEDVINSSYDPLGRLVSYTDAISGTTLLTYSATNLVSMKDPVGNVTTYSYDAAGRRTKQRDAAGEEQDYGYDAANNLTSINYTDGTTSYSLDSRSYDPRNELATDSISGPGLSAALTTTYSYDLHGNLVREQHPNNDVTFNGYDLVDQLVSREIDKGNPNLPSGAHQQTFSYDAAGNPLGQVDFRGATSTLSVDGDNRITQQVDSYSGAPTITTALGYDPNGNRVLARETISGQAQSYVTTYNLANWPTSTSDNNGAFVTRYGGDGEGRQVVYATASLPYGAINTDPDNEGRWQTVSEGLRAGIPQLPSRFGYNGNDLPTSASYYNGVQQAIQYDGASRLTQVTASGVPGLNSTYTYGYDAAGWTTSVGTSLNGGATSTQTLTHDGAGRLTASTGGTPTGSWQYDPHDNLTSATSNGTTSTYTYSASVANELASVATVGQATVSYGYDGDGHTTSISNGGSINTQLTYDAKGRLATVTLANGTRIAITYNGQGQRATYSVTPHGASQPSLSEHFLYQQSALVQVAVSGTGIGTPYTDSYIYRQDGSPLELIRVAGSTTSRYWYVLDGRKNVVALTDVNGTVVDSYQYDLWGTPTSVTRACRSGCATPATGTTRNLAGTG